MELNKLSLIQSLAFHKDWTGRTAQKLGWVTVILHRIWIVNANFNQRQSLIAGNLRTEKFWNSMRRHVPADAHLLHSLLPFFFCFSLPLSFLAIYSCTSVLPPFRLPALPAGCGRRSSLYYQYHQSRKCTAFHNQWITEFIAKFPSTF